MSEHKIELEGGSSVRLMTAGKYCDRDIVVTAKEDSSGYDEGFADGKQAEYDRLVDPTKIIEKSVSGSVIRVDDVSEIPHKCTMSVDKDTNVSVCGKNLLNVPSEIDASTGFPAIELDFTGTFTVSFEAEIESVSNSSSLISVVVDGVTNRISHGSTIMTYTGRLTKVAYDNWCHMVGCIRNLQIEVGSTATAYEPYQGSTHPITAGQTIEVDSICPTMTVTADNDATITFGYHKSWGMQTEYDRFWDAYQQSGNKTNYDQAFAYTHWTDETYNPKYDIVCEGGTSARQTFYNSRITDTKVPIIVRNTELNATFAGSAIKTIPLLELDGVTGIRNHPFSGCSALESIHFMGTIDYDISFQWSTKLDNDSIWDIVMALAWIETDAGEENRTLTLSQTAVDNAFPDIGEWDDGLLPCIPDNWSLTIV